MPDKVFLPLNRKKLLLNTVGETRIVQIARITRIELVRFMLHGVMYYFNHLIR